MSTISGFLITKLSVDIFSSNFKEDYGTRRQKAMPVKHSGDLVSESNNVHTEQKNSTDKDITRYLSSVAKPIGTVFAGSTLDCCNSFLSNIISKDIAKLQCVKYDLAQMLFFSLCHVELLALASCMYQNFNNI